MTIYGIHAYIILMNQSQFCVTLCYSYYMRNHIRHNYSSLIHCLRAFHILFFAYLLFRCYCYNYYKTQKYYFCYRYLYDHIILLQNTLLQILSYPGVVELITQLLILKNILWLPLCRINKFGLYFTLESCCDPLHLWVINKLCIKNRICQNQSGLQQSEHSPCFQYPENSTKIRKNSQVVQQHSAKRIRIVWHSSKNVKSRTTAKVSVLHRTNQQAL